MLFTNRKLYKTADMVYERFYDDANRRLGHLSRRNADPETRIFDEQYYKQFDQQQNLDKELMRALDELCHSLPKSLGHRDKRPTDRELVMLYKRLQEHIAEAIVIEQDYGHNQWKLLMYRSLHRYVVTLRSHLCHDLGLSNKVQSAPQQIEPTQPPAEQPNRNLSIMEPRGEHDDLDVPEFLRDDYQPSPA